MNKDVEIRVAYLKAIPFLRHVPETDLRALAERMEPATFSAGTFIFDINDPSESMYIVQTGEIEILTTGGVPIAIIRSGSMLGEVGFLAQTERSVQARALSEIHLWVLRHSDFQSLAAERPSLALAIDRALSRHKHREVSRPSVEKLQEIALFHGLNEEQLSEIVPHLESEFFEAESTIYTPGGPGDRVYIVARGLVSIGRPVGTEIQELYRARTGEFFGEEEVLGNDLRQRVAIALDPTTCWMLNANDLDLLVNQYPRIALNMARLAGRRAFLEGEKVLPVASVPTVAPPPTPIEPALPTPASGSAQPKPAQKRGGLLAWYRYLDASARIRVAAFLVLLIWLLGVSVPVMAREALRENRLYARVDHSALKTTVIGNSPAGVPLATNLELSHPTPTPTPPPTPTPAK